MAFGFCGEALAGESVRLPERFSLDEIDSYLSSQVRLPERVGLTVAILKDGELVLSKGYGKSSLATGAVPRGDTRFAIGSVSKQFTCACILLLAEEGRLSVDDVAARYYPDLTRANDITLLDLMTHVSGYPDYYPLDFVDRRMQQAIEPDELLRRYAGGKLDFEPRSRWSYSNTGYILLGRVVEKVTGESFGQFLRRRILEPTGMTNTYYETPGSGEGWAEGYTSFALSDPESVAPEASGWIGAAGGIYSTVEDLVKWDKAMMDGKILKPESFKIMTSARVLADGRLTDYGCGLGIRSEAGRKILTHNGAVSGFNAFNAWVPATRSAVVMLCNMEGGLGTLPAQILSLVSKDPARLPTVEGPAILDTVREIFKQLQHGKVDRRRFSADFNEYLTPERVRGAGRRLRRYGTPESVEIQNAYERGGMEVSVTRLTFKDGNLRALMYRMPNGEIQQFFVNKSQ